MHWAGPMEVDDRLISAASELRCSIAAQRQVRQRSKHKHARIYPSATSRVGACSLAPSRDCDQALSDTSVRGICDGRYGSSSRQRCGAERYRSKVLYYRCSTMVVSDRKVLRSPEGAGLRAARAIAQSLAYPIVSDVTTT